MSKIRIKEKRGQIMIKKIIRMPVINVKYKHCNPTRDYCPREQKVPERPITKCTNVQCGKFIFVSKKKFVKAIHEKKINHDQREKYSENENDQSVKNAVLKFLDEGKHASQISRITCFSPSKTSRIIKGLKINKYISAKSGKPIFYEVINAGKTYIINVSKKPKEEV